MFGRMPFPDPISARIYFDNDVGPHAVFTSNRVASFNPGCQCRIHQFNCQIYGPAGRSSPSVMVVILVTMLPDLVTGPVYFHHDPALEPLP